MRLCPLALLLLLVPSLDSRPEALARDKQDEAAEFRKRLAQRQAGARKRLDEARRTLADQKKADDDAAAALRKRLAAKPLTLTLRAGGSHANATVRAFTFTDVEIDVAGRTLSLPWPSVAPPSILAAADILFDADKAEPQYDRGRFLIAQRLWKEALEAFQRAVKLNPDFEDRCERVREELDKAIAGQGTFHGSPRRVGPGGLVLTYDFKDAAQLRDFEEGFTHAPGAAVLDVKEETWVNLDVEWKDELEAEIRVSADAPFSLALMTDYELTLAPDGLTLDHVETPEDGDEKRTKIARSDKAKLAKGKTHLLHVTIRDRRCRALLDGQEALTAALPAKDALTGYFAVGLRSGKATIAAPLVVRGRTDPKALDKRFAEAEILVRRAADPDLRDVEDLRDRDRAAEALGAVDGIRLTADDAYFTLRHLGRDLAQYDDVKRALAAYLAGGRDEAKSGLDELLTKHPDVPSLHYLKALWRYQKEDVAAAREDVRKALQLFPEFAEAHALEAKLLDWDSDFAAAVASAQRAIEALPDYAPAYVLRAIAAYGNDPSAGPRAVEDLQIAVTLQPSNREGPTYLRALRYQMRGPRDLGCRFAFESAHYVVTTDISADAAKTYAERLEAAYRHFAETFQRAYQEKKFRKPRVAIFNTAENFYTYSELVSDERGEDNLGHFTDRWNELVLFETTDMAETLDTLYHESFHHFTTLMVRHTLPYWYNEGIAEYMAAITVKDGRVAEKGRLQEGRLEDLRLALDADIVLPFERIMCETPAEFYSGLVDFKYAQAWSMLHFFYEHEKGKHRPLIEKYFDRLREKKTIREAYDTVFKDSAEALEKEWRAYVAGLKP